MRQLRLLLPALLLSLGLATACGSNTTAPPPPPPPGPELATGLIYTNPPETAEWRLTKDATSTSTRLVLNLIGPQGYKSRGAGFTLWGGPGVRFVAFDHGLPINDLGVYQLRNAPGDITEPMALAGIVKPGNFLSVGAYQKGRQHDAKDSGAPLFQIAVEFDPAAKLRVGMKPMLTLQKAKVIPEDIGSPSDDPWALARKAQLEPITIALGKLSAQ